MIKKIFPIFTIFLLIITGVSVLAEVSGKDNAFIISTKNEVINFSQTYVEKKGDFATISLDESDIFLMDEGKPMLPVVSKIFTYPLETRIKNIKCAYTSISEEIIQDKIIPSPKTIPTMSINKGKENDSDTLLIDEKVYKSADIYPEKWYNYRITCGNDCINVILNIYPVRYKPLDNVLIKINDIDILITTEIPKVKPLESSVEFDMVIIAPQLFTDQLQPLITHKEKMGISTYLKTTEEIYSQYSGRDAAEKIKLFIKDALETNDITYVLLVGGMKGQQKEWYVPVRESNLDDYSDFEKSYISDLYFSDIYRYNESSMSVEFDDWDSNHNDIFAEWTSTEKDIIDGYPDVIIGRLACRTTREVKIVVNKIINYESKNHLSFWANRMIVVAGDTDPDDWSPGYEGELETTVSSNYMKDIGYKIIKLYTSDNSLRRPANVARQIRLGASFVHFAGHGNPSIWSTHLPDSNLWVDGPSVFDMPFIINGKRLPIVVVGGCHNSQFNVTLLNIKEGIEREGMQYFTGRPPRNNGSFWLYDWVPECWSWELVKLKNGGSIATIGNTNLGYSYVGDYAPEGLGGWIEGRFFQSIAVQNMETIGQAHTQAIRDYVNKFDINTDQLDCKTVQGWVLLGDPSLKIGGYS